MAENSNTARNVEDRDDKREVFCTVLPRLGNCWSLSEGKKKKRHGLRVFSPSACYGYCCYVTNAALTEPLQTAILLSSQIL